MAIKPLKIWKKVFTKIRALVTICIILIIILIISSNRAILLADADTLPNIKITEIMYNPLGDDTKYEFIELFMGANLNGVNLSNIYIDEIDFTFPNTIWNSPSTYLAIARSKDGFEERYNFSPYSAFKSALPNSGGNLTITMKIQSNDSNTTSIIDKISYKDTSKEGFSLIRQEDLLIPGSVQGGTPGREDNISDNSEEQNSSSECYTYKINFKMNKEVNNKERLTFTPEISPKLREEDKLAYWIEDMEKRIIKEKISTSTLSEKSFTPNIQSEIVLLKLIGEIESKCGSSTNISRTEEIFIVYNKDKILKINPKKNIKSGDDLSLEIEAFGISNLTLEIENIIKKSISKPRGTLKEEITIPNKIICAIAKENIINIKLDGEGITASQNLSLSNLCRNSKLNKVYTLAKKVYEGRNITIFVSFDQDLSTDNYYISLFNRNDAQMKSTIGESSPLKFNMVLNEGINKVRAELRRENSIIESIDTEIEAEALQTLEIDSNELAQKGESSETSVSFKTSPDIHETNQDKSAKKGVTSKTYYVFLGLSLIGNIILMWRN